jgi:excisionase family DNA binding protein
MSTSVHAQAEILDADAVAVLLRCDVGTVEDKTRRGVLPAVKFGRSWVYPRAALMQRLVELALERSNTDLDASECGDEPGRPHSKAARLKPMMVPVQEAHSGARLRRRAVAPALPSLPDAA